MGFKYFGLVLALFVGVAPKSVYSQVSKAPFNYDDETQAGAALLFLELYNANLAGGKSGVCLDWKMDEQGKPQYRAAFDTNVFETGSNQLGKGFNLESFKKLTDAMAKAQNGKVKVAVDGYADGQHYQSSSYKVEESIKKNQSLSAERAEQIGNLLKSNPNVTLGEVVGHASPILERKYPEKSNGLNCPTRRKVVLTFDQPSPKIESRFEGSFFGAPESMGNRSKSAISQEFRDKVHKVADKREAARGGERYKKISDEANSIFAELIKEKALNPKCELAPFKQMTLAMIEYYVGESNDKDGLIRKQMKNSGFKLQDIDGGASVLEEACLVHSKKIVDTMKAESKKFSLSGADFMKKEGLNSSNGSVTIGFDAAKLDRHLVRSGPNEGQKLRGFFCQGCGSGLFFHDDANHQGSFKPEYIDRMVRFTGDGNSRDRFIQNLNELSDADPFSTAAYLKPRMFVVKGCKNCECDTTDRIRSKDASVVSFDPLAQSGGQQQISLTDLQNACVIRPPVHHSCNVEPVKNSGTDKAAIQKMLSYQVALEDLKVTAPNVNALADLVSNRCPTEKRVLDKDAKIRSVMCSPESHNALPTDNEEKDCKEFAGREQGSHIGN